MYKLILGCWGEEGVLTFATYEDADKYIREYVAEWEEQPLPEYCYRLYKDGKEIESGWY